ncbi:hypothetical protein [Streptomyces sp. enrichment culture]|uniref:hypothetical protein n=1 Tax=Streptomyces sp. enrichment culture TaxID=1795815 RepID=UPI003F5727FD
MSDEESWYVLVETGDDFRLEMVEHVEGGVEHARERALELAKVCTPGTSKYLWEGPRSVFRISENELIVVVRSNELSWQKSKFRVTVGELIHTQEYVEEPLAPEGESGRRKFFPRNK